MKNRTSDVIPDGAVCVDNNTGCLQPCGRKAKRASRMSCPGRECLRHPGRRIKVNVQRKNQKDTKTIQVEGD